jgi:hypothetical protein
VCQVIGEMILALSRKYILDHMIFIGQANLERDSKGTNVT